MAIVGGVGVLVGFVVRASSLAGWWKLLAVQDTGGDESFAWTDDHLGDQAVSLDGAVVLPAHPARGLTPGHTCIVAAIDSPRRRQETAPAAGISRHTSQARPASMPTGPAVDVTGG